MTELWRYPVKSMGGERDRARRGSTGAARAATAPTPSCSSRKTGRRPLTAREAPTAARLQGQLPVRAGRGARPVRTRPPPRSPRPTAQPHAVATTPAAARADGGDSATTCELERDVKGIQDLGQVAADHHRGRRAARSRRSSARRSTSAASAPTSTWTSTPRAWDDLGWEGGRMRFEGGVDPAAAAPVRALRDPEPRSGHPGEVARAAHATSPREHGNRSASTRVSCVAGRIAVGQSVRSH